MLEDVPGLISPIIQAMVANRNRQVQAADLQEKIRSNKAEEGLHAQQLSQAQAIADRQAEMTQQQIDSENEIRKAQVRGLATQNTMQALQLLKQGIPRNVVEGMMGMSLMQHLGQPSNQSPTAATGANPQQQVQSFFGQPGSYGQPQPQPQPQPNVQPSGDPLDNIDWGAVRQNELNQLEQTEAAKSRGAAEGAAPIQAAQAKQAFDYQTARDQARNQFEVEQLNRTQAFEAAQNALNRTNQLDVAKLSRGAQMRIAQLDAGIKLKQIGAEYGLDPGASSALGLAIFGGGQKADKNNPVMRRIVSTGISQGFKEPDKDIDELKALNEIEPAISDFRDFSQNTLKSTGAGRYIQQGLGAFGTDAKKQEEQLKARFQQIGKGLEGFSGGRQLASQFSAEAGSMPSLNDTKSQGINKVNAFEKMVYERKQDILKNYSPQQIELFQQYNPGLKLNTTLMQSPDGIMREVDNKDVQHYTQLGAKVVKVQ